MELKVAIRQKALTRAGLRAAEKHGKREDARSRARRVNEREPLVWGSLDITHAYDEHMTRDGVKATTNAGAKNVAMHAIVQFPTNLPATEENQKMIFAAAREFINETHGGDAVFAMRLDRDEFGTNKVDVFYTPTYVKTLKSGKSTRWASLTKFGKELCHEHREEIARRHGGRFSTGPRQCGIALNSALRAYLVKKWQWQLAEKQEKQSRYSDWLTPEEYKARKFYELSKQSNNIVAGLKKVIKYYVPTFGDRDKRTMKNLLKLSKEEAGLQPNFEQNSEYTRSASKIEREEMSTKQEQNFKMK